MDVAGEVEAVGAGVEGFATGDRVYGLIGGVGGLQGAHAQYVSADARLLAKRPANLDARAAAALPLVAITAWEGLVDRAQIRPGQTVLVQGGAGGVGHLAVQIALAKGARVFATALGEQDQAYLRSLGAVAIDGARSVEDYVAELTAGAGFEVVYDTGGGAPLGCVVPGRQKVRPRGQLPGLGRARAGAALVQAGDLFGGLHASAAVER